MVKPDHRQSHAVPTVGNGQIGGAVPANSAPYVRHGIGNLAKAILANLMPYVRYGNGKLEGLVFANSAPYVRHGIGNLRMAFPANLMPYVRYGIGKSEKHTPRSSACQALAQYHRIVADSAKESTLKVAKVIQSKKV